MSKQNGTKVQLTWTDVDGLANNVVNSILDSLPSLMLTPSLLRAYPVPNGGIPAALSIQNAFHKRPSPSRMLITEDPAEADVILDDIVDSGATKKKFKGKRFFALIDKLAPRIITAAADTHWYVFPWERAIRQDGPEDNIIRILQYIGEDPTREGLKDTPKRVIKSYNELFGGYKQDPSELLTVFEDGACDEQVILKGIEFVSHCEHHMLPFYGTAHVAYIPDKRVIGVSKLVRLLEVYSNRLQIQERLCQQVTDSLDVHLTPKGSACIIEAKHMCMMCRGVRKQGSVMITSSLTGIYKSDPAARMELMSLIKD